MNRADRGPLLLIVAGVLLLLAVVAYLINDAEDNSRHRAATLRDRKELQAQAQRSIVELRAMREEHARTAQDRAELREQHEVVRRSLDRIEKLLDQMASTGCRH